MAEESPLKPFYSVLVLAFVCSALVAGAAVGLRPLQEANRQLDQKKNILLAAGILQDKVPVAEQFQIIEPRIIELISGEFVSPANLDPTSYDQSKAALDAELGHPLSPNEDPARLRRVEQYALIYLVRNTEKNQYSQIILPMRGKGLWSTMYAYVALDAHATTIHGISFYAHGETPGLGGEIENERWQQGWQGKQIYKTDGSVGIHLVKGKAPEQGEQASYAIDGLSGATMTANGVSALLQFWFGDHGFKPFLKRMQEEDANG